MSPMNDGQNPKEENRHCECKEEPGVLLIITTQTTVEGPKTPQFQSIHKFHVVQDAKCGSFYFPSDQSLSLLWSTFETRYNCTSCFDVGQPAVELCL